MEKTHGKIGTEKKYLKEIQSADKKIHGKNIVEKKTTDKISATTRVE